MHLLLVVALLGVAFAAPAFATIKPTNWSRAGTQTDDLFGRSVAPAGDVDLDGFGDLLVGAPGFDSALNNAGAAYLYRGGANGPTAAPVWEYVGTQTGAGTGTVVAPAGDVNNDGWPDVIVGSPQYNTGGINVDAGRIDVFFGSAFGLSATPSQTFLGSGLAARFGFSVASAGDIDGDGFDDVIVGAPGWIVQDLDEGAAFLFRGTAGGLVATTWFANGGQENAQLGYSVSGAGDVNGDGFADVIVGSPGRGFNFTAEGFAYLYLGGDLGLAGAPVSTVGGINDQSFYGGAVANAGDVNGDGYADVLIGARNGNDGQANTGYAEVRAGSSSGLGAILWSSFGVENEERFGVSLATAGDLNGDDYADFVVGADQYPSAADKFGRVAVWLGGPGVPGLLTHLLGEVTGEEMGYSVGTAGDLDNDGFSDLVFGLPGATVNVPTDGRVALWRGGASWPVEASGWPQAESEPNVLFGSGLAGGVDARNLGADDLFIGVPLADQGFSDAGKVRVAQAGNPAPLLLGGFVAAGDRPLGRFGIEMARAGDVDEDYHEDLVLGSVTYVNGEGSEGVAQVLFGSASGLESTPTWKYESNLVSDQVGRSVDAGDFDGDGRNDLLVGAFSASVDGHDGKARVFRGSAAGPETSPSWTTAPASGNTWLGFEVAAGDWDADGYADAAVGAPNAADGQSIEGLVYVYFGGPGGLSLTPTWTLQVNVPNASLGYSLANAGDVNGDGVADLLAGAPGAFFTGRAYLFPGSRSRSMPDPGNVRVFAPDVATATFGNAVAGIGDVDKDGYADILVGAPQHSNGQLNEGGVWLFRGSDLGGELVPWWKRESNVVEARYGSTLTRMGDANSDGWPDFAVAAPYQGAGGTVHVYHGGGGRLLHGTSQTFPGPTTLYLWMGGTIPNAGTAIAPYVLLRSAAGRVKKSFVEVQMGTMNEAWVGGTRTFTGPYDTGVPGVGVGSLLPVQFALGGLAPGLAWRWRERSVTSSPFFPHSPWRQPRAFETAGHHFRTGGTNVAVDPSFAGRTAGVRLAAIEPSPSRAGARLRYRLSQAGDVGLTLHDVRGRLVRSLVAGRIEAGEHDVAFDGRDGEGRALTAGIYFVALESGGSRDTKKFVRLP